MPVWKAKKLMEFICLLAFSSTEISYYLSKNFTVLRKYIFTISFPKMLSICDI
jgi:hypothetical protein